MKAFAAVAVAMVILAPGALAQSPRGMTTPSVVDAQGRYVGDVVGVGSGQARGAGAVRLELDTGGAVIVAVGRKGGALTWIADRDLYFASTNCAGTPWIGAPTPQLVENVGVVYEHTLWYADAEAPLAGVEFRSMLRTTGTCDASAQGGGLLLPLERSVDLDSAFSRPLKLVETRQRPVR